MVVSLPPDGLTRSVQRGAMVIKNTNSITHLYRYSYCQMIEQMFCYVAIL